MDKKLLDDHWSKTQHWKWGAIYVCAKDPRIVVPKRTPWLGWTFNFAHRSAYLLLITVIVGAVAPSLAVVREGRFDQLPLTILFSCVAIGVLIYLVGRVGRD